VSLTHCPACGEPLPKPKLGRPPKEPKTQPDGTVTWLCTCCETYLHEDYFGVDNNAVNGLTSWCKRCRRGKD
jgi:hypothetical protein